MSTNNFGKYIAIDETEARYGCPHCGSVGRSTRLFYASHASQYECLMCDGEYIIVLDGGSSAPHGFGDPARTFDRLAKQPHPYRGAGES